MVAPKKSLGQHWLHDPDSLRAMCDAAGITKDDTVLEIGPGLGTLTQQLVKRAKKVIAVEFDPELAEKLPSRVVADNLEVVHSDILKFDLSKLPNDYKVVANVPYYITSKIVHLLLTSTNSPKASALLVQKEVAERIAARQGDMGILAVASQLYAVVTLHRIVPAKLFTPPPKVDSQIVSLMRREQSLFKDLDETKFFRLVKAGFSERRKKLRSSLSGGLHISKERTDDLLKMASIDPELRAQALSMQDWYALYEAWSKSTPSS